MPVLAAVRAEEPEAYSNSILNAVNKDVSPNLLTRLFPGLRALQGRRAGWLYVRLDRLENAGLIESWRSKEMFPERGYRPRRYYRLTAMGIAVLALRALRGVL